MSRPVPRLGSVGLLCVHVSGTGTVPGAWVCSSGLHPHTGQGCLTKWIQPTRLETRTKESNICASIKVTETLVRNESEGKFDLLRWDAWVRPLLHHRPIWIFLKDLSKSTSVGTRKTVNYACIG